jgi:hypothetical protein
MKPAACRARLRHLVHSRYPVTSGVVSFLLLLGCRRARITGDLRKSTRRLYQRNTHMSNQAAIGKTVGTRLGSGRGVLRANSMPFTVAEGAAMVNKSEDKGAEGCAARLGRLSSVLWSRRSRWRLQAKGVLSRRSARRRRDPTVAKEAGPCRWPPTGTAAGIRARKAGAPSSSWP